MEGEGGAFVRADQQLGRHPANGEQLGAVVIVICWVEVMANAEVGNLDMVVRGYEAVPSGQVAMDDPLGEEEGHAISNLQHHTRQGMGREGAGLAGYWVVG